MPLAQTLITKSWNIIWGFLLFEKLFHQLVSINLKDLTYHQLFQECQTQNNLLCAAAINTRKIL